MAGKTFSPVVHYLHTVLGSGKDGPPDGELLGRYLVGRDPIAFETLVRRHGPVVKGVCRRLLGAGADADDVYQATFLIFARKASGIRKRDSVGSWLFGVAYRLSKQQLTQLNRRRRETSIGPETEPLATNADPAQQASLRELAALLDEELMRLPAVCRAALIACHLEGLSAADAARQMGVPASTLKSRLERGRNLLRHRLQHRGIGLSVLAMTVLLGEMTKAKAASALVKTTVQTALAFAATGTAPVASPAVALAVKAIQSAVISKIKLGLLAMLTCGVLGFGVAVTTMQATQQGSSATRKGKDSATLPLRVAEEEPVQVTKEKRVDLHGDDLPEGAVLRLGTVQLRAAGVNMALSADGKTLFGVQGGKYVSSWDANSGRLKETREFPTSTSEMALMSPGARWLATDGDALKVFDVQSAKLVHELAPGKDRFFTGVFSSDATRLAAVGRPFEPGDVYLLRIWDLASGKETFATKLKVSGGSQLLSFSPDGKKLIAGFSSSTADQRLYCWDLDSNDLLWESKDFHTVSRIAAFTPERVLVSTYPPLDVATGKPVRLNNLPKFPAFQYPHIAVTRDGRTLLDSNDQGIRVWDLQTGAQKCLLAGAADNFILAADDKTIITSNGFLQRWDLASGKPLYPDNFNDGHGDEVIDVVFSADGKRMASASVDGSVRFWDATTGRPIHVWRAHEARRPRPGLGRRAKDGANALDMTPDGRWVISTGGEYLLRLWDTSTGKEAASLPFPNPEPERAGERRVYRVRLSPDGSKAVGLLEAYYLSHWLATWDLKKGTLLTNVSVPRTQWVSSGISRDGRTVLLRPNVLNADNDLVDTVPITINVAGGKETARLDYGFLTTSYNPKPFVISPNGLLIAGSCFQETKKAPTTGFSVWEAATGKAIAQFKTKAMGQLAIHPNNRFVAVSDREGVHVWDIVDGKIVTSRKMPARVLSNTEWDEMHQSHASCLTFTPDGNRLATGHADGTILFWNIDLPAQKTVSLSSEEVEPLWNELKDADAAKAWQAVWRLADSPDEVLPFLRKNLKPFASVPEEVTRPLLADLDSDVFTKREAAGKQMQQLGLTAESALRARLKNSPSLETQRRIETLLKTIIETPEPLTPDSLRQLRAVAVLARINTSEAREVLESLTKGAESARLTNAARAALGK